MSLGPLGQIFNSAIKTTLLLIPQTVILANDDKLMNEIIANNQSIATKLPCSIEEFLVAQNLLPRSVVVEHNGEAVAPSEFSQRQLKASDRLEIVKIVAGG
jgi:thiamine biosynthesis protein ThiS